MSLDQDTICQARIQTTLAVLHVVTTEEVRLHGRNLVTCLVVHLGDDVALRCSVNDGKINVSVGDSVIQLQREVWKRSEEKHAIAWIDGYIAGYNQH